MKCDPSGKKDYQYPFVQMVFLDKHFTLKLQCF